MNLLNTIQVSQTQLVLVLNLMQAVIILQAEMVSLEKSINSHNWYGGVINLTTN
jgi:hypothetical protein